MGSGVSRIKGDCKDARLTIVETFPGIVRDAVIESVTELLRVGAVRTTSEEPGNPSALNIDTWAITDRSQFAEIVIETETVKTFFGGGPDNWRFDFKALVESLITAVRFEFIEASGLPFCVFAMRATLDASSLRCTSESAKSIDKLSRCLRVFVESLRGNSIQFISSRPACPASIHFGVVVEQSDLNRFHEAVKKSADVNVDIEKSLEIGETVRAMMPVEFESVNGICLMSYFRVATNLSLIVGHVDQLGMRGDGTPYVLLLTPDEPLTHFHFDAPIIPSVLTNVSEVMWRGPQLLAVPLALLSTNGAYWLDLKVIQEKLNSVSDKLASRGGRTADLVIVQGLSEIGVKLAAIDVDLGLIDTRVGDGLRRWRSDENPEWNEIAVPPGGGLTGRYFLETGMKDGYMTHLASSLLVNIENMKKLVYSLERQAEFLLGQAHNEVMRESMQQMKEATEATMHSTSAVKNATSAIAESQSQVRYLTYILAVLTTALIALGLYENGWEWQALLVAGGAFLLVALVYRSRRVYYHLSLSCAATIVMIVLVIHADSSSIQAIVIVAYLLAICLLVWRMIRGVRRSNQAE